jgi:UDP:flavonoid glycosyltransferase YjiC (YdhE family)
VRVLLSTTSGAGHFRPLLPLARALIDAGHDLAVAAPAESADMVEREGLQHLPFDGVPPDHPDRIDVFSRVPSMPLAEAEHLIGSEVFGRLNTTFALPGAQAALAGFQPDIVVHECAELSVRTAAAAHGIPTVALNPALTITAYATAMAAGIAPLRSALGLDPDPEGRDLLGTPTISWFPACFDVPAAVDYDVRRYREPVPTEPSADSERDLIYVTLGSEAAALPFFAEMITQVVAGARDAGLPVLVSTGKQVAPELLGDLDGVQVETWVDQAEVLRRSRVVVCHAGAGTTLGALVTGVPIVAVPLFADQPYNAARIEATGVGRQVAPGPTLRDDVAKATRELADKAPEASRRLAGEIAALPSVTAALPWLESVVASTGRGGGATPTLGR